MAPCALARAKICSSLDAAVGPDLLHERRIAEVEERGIRQDVV